VFEEELSKKVDEFSVCGLRTLLIGMKILSTKEYEEIDRKYNSFAQSLNREEDISNFILFFTELIYFF
jgi:hypothetical protein